jgi:nitroreductase
MDTQILNALNWRYATKLFNPSKQVKETDIEVLLEAIRLAPTSLGLQPLRVLLVKDKDLREKLKQAAWNQSQVTDASHLVIFAARKNLRDEYIDSYINKVALVRNQKNEEVQGYKQMLRNSANGKSESELFAWNSRQVYIALGMLLESAALMKIDACPMEGFDTQKFDEILGLTGTEYASVVMTTIGYRSESDKYALAPKVRWDKESLIEIR